MLDRAAAIVVTVAMLSTTAAPARAQMVDFDHVVAVAGSQATASQTMAREALLVALDIDRDARLESLRDRHDAFGRILKGMQHGDDGLGLPAAQTAEIAAELDLAEAHWQTTKAAILECLAAGDVTAEQVDVIASYSLELMAVFEEVASQYVEEAARNRLTSMLANAQLESIHGSTLSQRMATEFLLIAYGHDIEANRASLGNSVVQFDEMLNNLVNGNLERRLLPPPNDAVRDRLLRAQRVWEDQFRPIVRRALDAGEALPALAGQMLDANDNLLNQMSEIADLYVGL